MTIVQKRLESHGKTFSLWSIPLLCVWRHKVAPRLRKNPNKQNKPLPSRFYCSPVTIDLRDNDNKGILLSPGLTRQSSQFNLLHSERTFALNHCQMSNVTVALAYICQDHSRSSINVKKVLNSKTYGQNDQTIVMIGAIVIILRSKVNKLSICFINALSSY